MQNLRDKYHQDIFDKLLRIRKNSRKGDYPNNADGDSKISVSLAWEIIRQTGISPSFGDISGQSKGYIFEEINRDFLKKAFSRLQHLRPGNWIYSIQSKISDFDQYKHLADIEKIIIQNSQLASSLGKNYIISPDIVLARIPLSDSEINKNKRLIHKKDPVARLTPLRESNFANPAPILHASISCKWTLRSDRSQNSRTEALNLIRNRKGNLPHIVVITAEPTPTRIASLALGTGDIDCVYHFALNELREAIKMLNDESQMEILDMLVEGRRLRDISDLPFDLAI